MKNIKIYLMLLFIIVIGSCQKNKKELILHTVEEAHAKAMEGSLGTEISNPAVMLVYDNDGQIVSKKDFHSQKFEATDWVYKVTDLATYKTLVPDDMYATSEYAYPLSGNEMGQMIYAYDPYIENKITRTELETKWNNDLVKKYRFNDTRPGDLFVQRACGLCGGAGNQGASSVGHVGVVSTGTTLAAQGNNRNKFYNNTWIRHAWNAGVGYCGGNYAGGVRSNRLSDIWGCLRDAPNANNNRQLRYKWINATLETNLRNFVFAETGKPYNIFASRSWNKNVRPANYNCSLLAWQAYYVCTYTNTPYGPSYTSIDGNYSQSATIVFPNNIYNNSGVFNINNMP